MKPSMKTLGEVLYTQSQYVIPVYQRNYRWEKPEWDKLWDNLVEIQGPGKCGSHFMGFLVFVPELAQPGQHTRFHLVDGQQRLATSSVLLAALRNVARKEGHEELAQEIHEYCLVHPLKKGEQHYRLLPKERDHDSYVSIIGGHGQPTGRMAEALAHFEGKASGYSAGSLDALRQCFHTICQRLEFMCATLETEDAYNIFKSLNSTGVPLGPSDLIRNFMFMRIPSDEQDEFDSGLWRPLESHFARGDGTINDEHFSAFFRDFLMSGGRYVAPKDTFPAFELHYEATAFVPAELARALNANAAYYEVIHGRRPDCSSPVTQALAGLNRLESSTTYPLLLALFDRRGRGYITNEQLEEAITMLCGFIMRRFVCGESSRSYGRMFVSAVSQLTDNPVKSLEHYLLDRGWPDDQQFQAAFVEFPLFKRGYTREVLEAIERARGHKEPADLKGAQVEHIMPQTLSDSWREALGPDAERIQTDWLHSPGNLTLSGYNPELLNHPFEVKRVEYTKSNIVITRELENYEHWNEENIRSRGQLFAKEAARIWIGPRQKVVRSKSVAASDKVGDPSKSGLSPTKQLQLEYWEAFRKTVLERNGVIKPRKALPQHWTDFSIGCTGIHLDALIDSQKLRAGVELAMVGPNAKAEFYSLYDQRDDIEDAIGEPLTWHELPNRKSSYLSLYRPDSSLFERHTWQTQHEWLLEKLELFHQTLAPRVKLLGGGTKPGWSGDWLLNTDETHHKGGFAKMLELGVIAIWGYEDGAGPLAKMSENNRVFAYVSGIGIVAVGRVTGDPPYPSDNVFGRSSQQEFHRKVLWVVVTEPEMAFTAQESRELGYSLPAYGTLSRMYAGEIADQIENELKSRNER